VTPLLLISEVDSRDPFHHGLVTGELHPGPILSLLQSHPFTDLLLLLNPEQEVGELLEELARRHPDVNVQWQHLTYDVDPRAVARTVRCASRWTRHADPFPASAHTFLSVRAAPSTMSPG